MATLSGGRWLAVAAVARQLGADPFALFGRRASWALPELAAALQTASARECHASQAWSKSRHELGAGAAASAAARHSAPSPHSGPVGSGPPSSHS
jgi:hypothetical protein